VRGRRFKVSTETSSHEMACPFVFMGWST